MKEENITQPVSELYEIVIKVAFLLTPVLLITLLILITIKLGIGGV